MTSLGCFRKQALSRVFLSRSFFKGKNSYCIYEK